MAITDQPFTAIVNAAGRAIISFRPPTSRANYIVQQVSVEYATAPIGCTCDVRKNGRLISPVIPTGDSAAGDPPVPIGGGSDILTVNFAGGTPGDIVNVYIIYDDGS
jgi:hypothetical protein